MEKDGRRAGYTEVLYCSDSDGMFTFKKLLSFVGPAFFISVGYLDPGNCMYSVMVVFLWCEEGLSVVEKVSACEQAQRYAPIASQHSHIHRGD